MPDLQDLLRKDYDSYSADIVNLAGKMRDEAKVLGPRQRKKLREHMMDLSVEESIPAMQHLYAIAQHKDGEPVPCAACRFLEGD